MVKESNPGCCHKDLALMVRTLPVELPGQAPCAQSVSNHLSQLETGIISKGLVAKTGNNKG